MHELALMDDLVSAVVETLEESGIARAVSIKLEVGKLAGVAPESLRFCFDVCAAGTGAEGAELVIEESEGDALRLVELEVS